MGGKNQGKQTEGVSHSSSNQTVWGATFDLFFGFLAQKLLFVLRACLWDAVFDTTELPFKGCVHNLTFDHCMGWRSKSAELLHSVVVVIVVGTVVVVVVFVVPNVWKATFVPEVW